MRNNRSTTTLKNSMSMLSAMLLVYLLFLGCVKNREFDALEPACQTSLKATNTFAEIKALYVEETLQIQDDLIIEGYVISSDVVGNFFGVLHFQDAPVNPTEAFQLEIDLRDSHLFFVVGDKIQIKLKGLYLGKSKGVYKLGGTFISFGNVTVGRLPSNAVFEHVFVTCDSREAIMPTLVKVSELSKTNANTLVQLENIEFSEDELGLPFAVDREETIRLLVSCDDSELEMVNSGFSDFQAEVLPEGRGTITGVLIQDNDDFQLQIRDLNDITFTKERCEDVIDKFTSQNIFFSELADPDNDATARFIELYNASEASLSLKGWQILRYTNDSDEVSSSLDLSDFTIESNSTLVIAADAEGFLNSYGFPANVVSGSNSPADSNGDDNLQLVDPFGTVIDLFGVVGADGSGTNHEFEDGRAARKSEVTIGSPIFNPAEWVIYNDTGNGSTINLPQIAPQDFSPGIR